MQLVVNCIEKAHSEEKNMCIVTVKKTDGQIEKRDYTPPPASARPGEKPVRVGIAPSVHNPAVSSGRVIKMGHSSQDRTLIRGY